MLCFVYQLLCVLIIAKTKMKKAMGWALRKLSPKISLILGMIRFCYYNFVNKLYTLKEKKKFSNVHFVLSCTDQFGFFRFKTPVHKTYGISLIYENVRSNASPTCVPFIKCIQCIIQLVLWFKICYLILCHIYTICAAHSVSSCRAIWWKRT